MIWFTLGLSPLKAEKKGAILQSATMDIIGIDKIDSNDRSFCISYPLEDDLLLASIDRFGVLLPLSLLSRDKPIVVAGFKRIHTAKQLGITEVPCVFLDVDERQALIAAINDNITRTLNTVEKVFCLSKMLAAGFPRKEVCDVAGLLGLPPREDTLETAVAAASLDEDLLSFIVKRRLPLPLVEQFLWFDGPEQRRIMRLADGVGGTVGSFREMLQLMMLLKVKRGGIDFRQLDGAKDADEARQRLKRQTNPLLVGLEQKLASLLSAGALPPHIKVRVDPAFEKESIEVSLRADNVREIEEALTKLEHLAGEGLFRSIFDLTHGTPHRV